MCWPINFIPLYYNNHSTTFYKTYTTSRNQALPFTRRIWSGAVSLVVLSPSPTPSGCSRNRRQAHQRKSHINELTRRAVMCSQLYPVDARDIPYLSIMYWSNRSNFKWFWDTQTDIIIPTCTIFLGRFLSVRPVPSILHLPVSVLVDVVYFRNGTENDERRNRKKMRLPVPRFAAATRRHTIRHINMKYATRSKPITGNV